MQTSTGRLNAASATSSATRTPTTPSTPRSRAETTGRESSGSSTPDGTNNFASGIPSFSTAVAALPEGGTDPLVSAIYEPVPDALYLARRGEGATVNGDPLSADSELSLDRGTVSLVVGLPAIRDPDRAATAQRIERSLREQSKRVIQTWSPTVDFGLLARGAIEGLVYVHPQGHEQYAGALLASESGVVSGERDDVYVGASNPETLTAIRSAVATAT
ncbi:inositol monophosphatase family protein [Haloplanus sp. GCM10025708]|uniref:inositol monophosphatase family protein n=1 Tax=Haloplanus sp. GCM10025708 TaxID=3252679 RepID=UPI00361DE48E